MSRETGWGDLGRGGSAVRSSMRGGVLATLLLSVVLRSVLIPPRAIALDLLSLISFGVVVLVLQDAMTRGSFGLARHLTAACRSYLFWCSVVVDLSMDYEVFRFPFSRRDRKWLAFLLTANLMRGHRDL